MSTRLKLLFPLLLIFVIATVLFIAGTDILSKHNIDKNVLLIANSFIFMMACIAFFTQQKALQNSNPNVFFRSVMGGMMLRMFLFVVAVILYKFLSGSNFSTAAVFISLFLYLIYLGFEVSIITKLNKQKNG